MSPAPLRRPLLLLAYAVASFLSFPHPLGERVLDLGWIVSWAVPALFLLGVDGLAPGRAARAGFLAGWLAHSAILHWIFVVTVRYGGAPWPVGIVAPIALASYMALIAAGIAWGWAWLSQRGRATPLAGALLWTALEHARSWLFSGFPWAVLGYAQHENGLLLPLASITGVTGLGFVVALLGAAVACSVRELSRRRTPGWRPWLAVLVVLAVHTFGAVRGEPEIPADAPRVRIAALQGNIDQGVKWNAAWAERTLGVYEELTRRAAASGARVVLWPETAVPGAIEGDAELRERLEGLARSTGAALVIGAVGLEPDEARGRWRYFDSAYVLDADGRWLDRYDKAHLVPFGEYVPLRDVWGGILGAVASGIAPADVTAGPGPRAVDVPLPPDRQRGDRAASGPDALRAGVPVCYELLFPALVRGFARDGGRVLLAITNDAWYGRTGAPYQFLAMTALRSAETGLWTVRAANTGVSAVIDAGGRVRERTPIFERAWIAADVPLGMPGTSTFYVRYGEWFATLCWVGLAAIGILSVVRRRGPEAAAADPTEPTGRRTAEAES